MSFANQSALSAVAVFKMDSIRERYQQHRANHLEFEAIVKSLKSDAEKLQALAKHPLYEKDDSIDGIIKFMKVYPHLTKSKGLASKISHLRKKMQFKMQRLEYANRFAFAVSEKISSDSAHKNGDANAPAPDASWVSVDDMAVDDQARENAQRQADIKTYEELVFSDADVDWAQFESIITALFTFETDSSKDAFKNIKKCTETFGKSLLTMKITAAEVKGLLITARGCADYANRQDEINTLINNPTAISEIAGVLSLMLADIKSWKWSEAGVPVQFYRHIKQKYRPYYSSNLLVWLFHEYLGCRWNCYFYSKFLSLYQPPFWKGTGGARGSINTARSNIHREGFCMQSLLKFIESYDTSDSELDSVAPSSTSPLGGRIENVQQRFQRLIVTECQLHQAMYPDDSFTVVQTDLANFGPSIPHRAILKIMEIFGVDSTWRAIFANIMDVPVLLEGATTPRALKRGFSSSSSLQTLFGELVLVCLDLQVNRHSGVSLYRLFDDIWFFSKNPKHAQRAWNITERFLTTCGLRLNKEKSGSVLVRSPSYLAKLSDPQTQFFGEAPLPQSPIYFNFMQLCSDGSLRVVPDKFMPYVVELKWRLEKATTLFDWASIYNRYMRFFMNNFGAISVALGRDHVDKIVAGFDQIHSQILPDHNGSALEYVSSMIRSRPLLFGENPSEIPEWWIYWPNFEGGLGLYNPYLSLSILKDAISPVKFDFNYLAQHDERIWNDMLKYIKYQNKDDRLRGEGGLAPDQPRLYIPCDPDSITFRPPITFLVDDYLEKKTKAKPKSKLRPSESDLDDASVSDSGDDELISRRPKKLVSLERFLQMRATFLPHWSRVYSELQEVVQPTFSDAEKKGYWAESTANAISMDERHYYARLEEIYKDDILELFSERRFIEAEQAPLGLLASWKRISF